MKFLRVSGVLVRTKHRGYHHAYECYRRDMRYDMHNLRVSAVFSGQHSRCRRHHCYFALCVHLLWIIIINIMNISNNNNNIIIIIIASSQYTSSYNEYIMHAGISHDWFRRLAHGAASMAEKHVFANIYMLCYDASWILWMLFAIFIYHFIKGKTRLCAMEVPLQTSRVCVCVCVSVAPETGNNSPYVLIRVCHLCS